ncbi:MAG: glutathione-disulfide reductase [Alphaproteobacteria bacterium]
MTSYDYDLFTIGAGSGGVRASRLAAQAGARVAVAEEDREGGTCVLRGCVPKKLLVLASHYTEDFDDAAGFGWHVGETHFDWPTLRDRVQANLTHLSGIYQRNLANAGAQTILDRAVVTGPHSVRLVNQGREITARTILVATGSWPYLPSSVMGIEHAVSSNEMFLLEHLPERLVIVGGGYIAVEFAGIMHGLGVDVTLIYRGTEILRGFDLDLRVMLRREMERKGIKVLIESDVKCIEKTGDGYVVILERDTEIPTDLVLYATGRVPHTQGLGLETAGVEMQNNGAIVVDEYSKTTCDSIYAIGDVTDRVNLTPVAIREGIAFVETVFKDNPTRPDYDCIPTAVFSQPPLGTVGMTDLDVLQAGIEFDIYKTHFRTMKNSFVDRDEHMLMKLIVERNTDRVLGCHLIGPDAPEMIQMVGIAVRMGATKAQFDATVAVHPTSAEELVTIRERFVPEEGDPRHRRTTAAGR